jgi:hypothetical protein
MNVFTALQACRSISFKLGPLAEAVVAQKIVSKSGKVN